MRVLAMRWNTPPSGRDPVVGHQSWWGATSRHVRISGVRQRTLLEPLIVASTSQSGGPRPRSFRSAREVTPTSGALCVRTGHSFFGGCIPPPVRGDLSGAAMQTKIGFTHLAPWGSRRVAPRHGVHTSGSWGGRCVGKLGFCVRFMRFGVMPALYSALTKPQTPPGFRRSEGFPRVFPVRARFALSRWPGSVRG